MAFFSITSTMLAENGVNVQQVFRPDDTRIRTIGDLQQVLAEDGCIAGTRWKFRHTAKELQQPKRIILGLSGIVSVETFDHPSKDNAPEPRGDQ